VAIYKKDEPLSSPFVSLFEEENLSEVWKLYYFGVCHRISLFRFTVINPVAHRRNGVVQIVQHIRCHLDRLLTGPPKILVPGRKLQPYSAVFTQNSLYFALVVG
jgi:hypothetical protein